jgi:hypothetical protein
MQEQTPSSSSWIPAPLSWATKTFVNAANATVKTASAIAYSPVAAVTFVTQIPSAVADICMNIPGSTNPYWLDCDPTVLANMTRLIENKTGAVAIPLYQCYETVFQTGRDYGSTPFGFQVCLLMWNGVLNPTVDAILNNVPSVFTLGDGIMSALVCVTGVTVIGLGTAALVSKCRKKPQGPLNEHDRLVSTRDDEVEPERATSRTVYEV